MDISFGVIVVNIGLSPALGWSAASPEASPGGRLHAVLERRPSIIEPGGRGLNRRF